MVSDSVDFGIVLEGVRTQLATITRLLVPAKGCLVMYEVVAVDPNGSVALISDEYISKVSTYPAFNADETRIAVFVSVVWTAEARPITT